MATMWTLDEYSRLKLTHTPSLKPNRKRTVIHEPVMETKVVRPKHHSYDANKKRQGIKSTFFDPRPLEKRCLDAAGLKEKSKKLQQCKPNIPYAKMISSSVVNVEVTKTIVKYLARPFLCSYARFSCVCVCRNVKNVK